jgi:hypothetical protein
MSAKASALETHEGPEVAPGPSSSPVSNAQIVGDGVNSGSGLGALTGVTFGVGFAVGILFTGVVGLACGAAAVPQLPELVLTTLGCWVVAPSEL